MKYQAQKRAVDRKNDRTAYKLGYKKKAFPYIVKRLLISWVICLVIGGIIGAAFDNNTSASEVDNLSEAPAPYGTRDGRSFADCEMSLDWGGEEDFTAIKCALSEETQEFTYYLSKGYYIDFSFVMAIMYCESSFRADIVSKTNDYGLMQINKINHEWLSEKLGLNDMTDPYQNIRAGIYILRNLFEKYDDPAKVLMAYNMGEYGASCLWEQGIYETSYSKRVLAKADEYKAELDIKK